MNRGNKKGSVFTKEEQLLLLELIVKEKHIIENKTTNKVANEEKDSAWGRVSRTFNSSSTNFRSVDQLKSKYDNLKTKARKVVAENRMYTVRTGGGGANTNQFDAVIEAVLQIINLKTVIGLENNVDCDYDDLETITLEEDTPLASDERAQVCIEELPSFGNMIQKETEINSETKRQAPCTSVTAVEDVVLINNSITTQNEEIPAPKKRKTDQNWTAYTPHKLRQRVSDKLRPTAENPIVAAKVEYYREKAKETKFDVALKKEEDRRREEEHQKKMQLIDIELQIKKEELRLKCNVIN